MVVLTVILMFVMMIVSMVVQYQVKSNFKKYLEVPSSSGLTGAEAAHLMLERSGVPNIEITLSQDGMLSDHYDPRGKIIRLSQEVYSGRSVASLGVACHEAGHAIQDAKQYAPLVIRNLAVPVAGFGSQAGVLIVIAGLMLGLTGLAWLGVILFSTVVVFQIINLPVEFDATARAKRALLQFNMITAGPESRGVDKVLNAAAMTYVAAMISSLVTLLYYVSILLSRRD